MVDSTRLLDAVVGGLSKAAARSPNDAQAKTGPSAATPVASAAQAALAGVAGLLLSSRRTRGIMGGSKLGSLALLGGLAYKAYRNYQAGKPLVEVAPRQGVDVTPKAPEGATPGPGPSGEDVAHTLAALEMPQSSGFHPVSQTEDDALLYLRAMVAAAAADGQVDAAERARIAQGMKQAGIDEDATRWLESELAAPADVEELSAGVSTPEKAAQVYTAARLAIDPDSLQEREFLRNLAEALDLDAKLRAEIDATAGAARG
jgi:uncharacterized membrane protein YebE (DUF533 family)